MDFAMHPQQASKIKLYGEYLTSLHWYEVTRAEKVGFLARFGLDSSPTFF